MAEQAATMGHSFLVALFGMAVSCPHGHLNELPCSGHGHCATDVAPGIDEQCVCDAGYVNADCSLRACPAGHAWSDYATANNTAHAMHFECSNMGECDRDSGMIADCFRFCMDLVEIVHPLPIGQCECREGFAGEACQRMRCPYGTLTAGQAHGVTSAPTSVPLLTLEVAGPSLECFGVGKCLSMREAAAQQDFVNLRSPLLVSLTLVLVLTLT